MTAKRSSGVFKKVLKFDDPQPAGLRRLFVGRGGAQEGVLKLTEDVVSAIEQAKEHAKALIEGAEAQAEVLRETAYQEGLARGHREVLEELAKVRLERANLHENARDDMLKLAFQVAKRVVRREIDWDDELTLRLVEDALEFARGDLDIEVRIHPGDRTILEQSVTRLQDHVDGVKIRFVDDPALMPGDCVVETESGVIDARLDTQMEAMQMEIRGARDDG